MTRLRKFRAWIEDEKRFIYPNEITFMPDVYYVYDSKSDHRYQIEPKFLQEWTGAWSTNKEMIYEGDIVKAFRANSYLDGDPLAIIWDQSVCGFIYDSWMSRVRRYQVGGKGNQNEIIGNIFENKDLLND